MTRRIIFVSIPILAMALLSIVLSTAALSQAQSECVLPLSSDSVSGNWDGTCLSTRPAPQDGGVRYARFYTFTVSSEAALAITLSSTEDTYLYVLHGHGTSGTVDYENDDLDNSGNTDSAVSETFQPGDYTIEATTYYAERTGEFRLTVSGLPSLITTPEPTDTPPPTVVTPEPSPEPGTPEPTPTESPTVVPLPTEKPETSMLVGSSYHACALFSDGRIDCWGDNEYGEVSGHPSSNGHIALSLGAKHSCALSDDGEIACWGANDKGQLSPPPGQGYAMLVSGDNHTCALHSNDEVDCWGSFAREPEPTPVPTPLPPTPAPTSSPQPEPTVSPSCSDFVPNANLSGCDLTGADLSGTDLSGAILTDTILIDVKLIGANLTGADLTATDLSGADLSGADVRHAKFRNANLDRMTVVGTQFRSGNRTDDGAMFRSAKLTHIVFASGLKLTEVGFINADISYSHFIDVDLQHADLRNTTAIDTDFSGANLGNAKMRSFELNRAIIDSKTDFEEADLTNADLSGMDLSGVDFENVDLGGANLSDGTFEDGKWDGVDLSGAGLDGCRFH